MMEIRELDKTEQKQAIALALDVSLLVEKPTMMKKVWVYS